MSDQDKYSVKPRSSSKKGIEGVGATSNSDGFSRSSGHMNGFPKCRAAWARTTGAVFAAMPASFLSSDVAIVVPKQAAEPFSALNFTIGSVDFIPGIDDLVLQSLVIAFVVKMLVELVQGSAQ